MNLGFDLEKIVDQRYSVRTYEEKALTKESKNLIKNYIKELDNPFHIPVSILLLETENSQKGEKLGTYGVIKGAKEYLGATVANRELALEALGYSFEKLVLYATSIGLGTCWLGGTFKRSSFANAMEVKEEELFPIISPLGYPIEKKRFMDSMVRRLAKSDQRKSWEQLFFLNDFAHPLTKDEAKEFAYPLEMVRLAPSASNKQPWRIVKSGLSYHFYKEKGYSVKMAYDIQEVDMGIAACHFLLAALEKGLTGEFKKLPTPEIAIPKDVDYRFSYVR